MKRLREWYDGLAERERKLLVLLLVLFVSFAVLLVPYGTSAMLASRRDHNEALRKAIGVVQGSRGRIDEIKERKEAVEKRYQNPAPPLAGFIENAARKSGLEIPESQDRADVPHGKKFVERATVVRLRKVPLLPLVKMLEALENSRHPIVVSRLNIRRRGREPDSYDVELGISAFDRVEKKAKGDKTSPSAAASGGAQ
jgi:type II secretory pathway component PulM